jgi:hypothetical protein
MLKMYQVFLAGYRPDQKHTVLKLPVFSGSSSRVFGR